jgi:hypothetical protein
VYTGAADDEAYLALPISALEAVAAQLAIIQDANEKLLAFHRGRRAQG